MFGRVAQSNKPQRKSAGPNSIKPKPKHQGRERLQHFAAGIRDAHQAIEDLEERISRLGAIIVESEAAQRELQSAINADGGVALQSYSSGNAKPDDPISKLVAHAKTSSEAAIAAAAALPHTEGLLQNARNQLTTLGEQRHSEIIRVIAQLADRDALAYQRAFDAACVLHDKLCGYAAVMEGNMGDIRLVHAPISMPRFATPSMGRPDADQYIRHNTSESTVNESASRWAAIKARLEADSEADIEDLQ